MVKSLVSKITSASNLSLASTFSAVAGNFSQETNYSKNRNDPGRFFGDGVQFKAKLIGILEVGEARGDRMCQEALQDLKMAIRAAGEHKQRISIHVTIDGLRLRDEKSGDSLYHHPVHKISFIAQDMTDSRAFGYIFGSPDSGHRFFGIKTDKAASQVVLAMRDLFQVVFELKKKEIELARQQIQTKSMHDHQFTSLSSLKANVEHNDLSGNTGKSSIDVLSSIGITGQDMSGLLRVEGATLEVKHAAVKEMSPESVADLVDLEQELSSLQRGISQMERITPNEVIKSLTGSIDKDEDPFGDSFTKFPTYNLRPPPESGRSRNKPSKTADGNTTAPTAAAKGVPSSFLSEVPMEGSDSPQILQQEEENSWLNEFDQENDVFDTTKTNNVLKNAIGCPIAPLALVETNITPTQQLEENVATLGDVEFMLNSGGNMTGGAGNVEALNVGGSDYATKPVKASDAFTDLDPLGIGRTRPYVDKKYFFQELKNPPKKVLKDLSLKEGSEDSLSETLAKMSMAATEQEALQQQQQLQQPQQQQQQQTQQLLKLTYTNNISGIRLTAITSTPLSNIFTLSPTTATSTTNMPLCNCTTSSTTTLTKSINKSLLTPVSGATIAPLIAKSSDNAINLHLNHYNLDGMRVADPRLLPRDTDPFSPTRKKSDPFQEGDIFSKLKAFELNIKEKNDTMQKQQQQQHQHQHQQQQQQHQHAPQQNFSPPNDVADNQIPGVDVFKGALQVSLPPELGMFPVEKLSWKSETSRAEQVSTIGESALPPTVGSTVRVRPSASGQLPPPSGAYTSSSVFKQQTVDVISSISNKKLPHLFGQTRFSKRDNSINMRRLQESDSLSENETAPEPPPRPESVSYAEPPPLPPKKQFNDIIIRPRVTSGNAVPPSSNVSTSRYDFFNSTAKLSSSTDAGDVPPIPLPLRRIGRSDGTYPGPGRPRKPGHTEDNYLAPIGDINSAINPDLPPLLPPPTQVSTRARAQRLAQAQPQPPPKAQEIYENRAKIQEQREEQSISPATILPDITLSQLLTLGIDELSAKLNVPPSKLNTMTIVELTTYLSEYIEKSKPTPFQRKQSQASSPESKSDQNQPPIFKVDFDQQSTFVAKFDDTFGEDMNQTRLDSFVANFEHFNEPPITHPSMPIDSSNTSNSIPTVPPADRYAVFREIIDKELQDRNESIDLMGESTPPDETASDNLTLQRPTPSPGGSITRDDFESISQSLSQPPTSKIDTKITEVVAQAKDRYAALRDIILVENLFDKKQAPPISDQFEDATREYSDFNEEFSLDQDVRHILEDGSGKANSDRLGLVDSRGYPTEPSSSALTVEDDNDDDDEEEDGAGGESSLDSNDKDRDVPRKSSIRGLTIDHYEKLSTSTQEVENAGKSDINNSTEAFTQKTTKRDNHFLKVTGVTGIKDDRSQKDDSEIDELMQRAISNLSIDSRSERVSPANSANAYGSTPAPKEGATLTAQCQFNDVSTSPIPLQKSPTTVQHNEKSSKLKTTNASPIPTQLSAVSNLIDAASKQISLDKGSSWATFDSPKSVFAAASGKGDKTAAAKSKSLHLPPPSNTSQNDTAESPCSSDPRDDGWSKSGAGGRRWMKKDRQQTSSSSRDLSPWDDEASDFPGQKRLPPQATQSIPHAERYGYYMRHARRMNSCDEDYEYEEELSNREYRKAKQGLSRSRDNFDLESPNWYYHPPHHTWSPQDIEAASSLRARNFDRSAYERITYGPPIYDKRGLPLAPGTTGKHYRKYYRDYVRPNYDFEEYGESPSNMERYREGGGRRADYENIYDEGRLPPSKARADYMYERDRKSFERDSVESFESTKRRRRSFGSGDIYCSMEARDDLHDRYMGGGEKTRSLRKGMKMRVAGEVDFEREFDGEFHQQRQRNVPSEARSVQRPMQLTGAGGVGPPPQTRMRKSSGSSPWDGEEPTLPGHKSWKRPGSATDTERRMAESRRNTTLEQTPSGSDGEKDRRTRKKQRSRNKELPATNARLGNYRDNYDYIAYDDEDIDDEDYVDEEYDEPPTDEDKFEHLNRCRYELHQRMLESERRKHSSGKQPKATAIKTRGFAQTSQKYQPSRGDDYDIDEYEQTPTPRSNASATNSNVPTLSGDSTKFSFDVGFESDFNQTSPPLAPAGSVSSCISTPAPLASTPATASLTAGGPTGKSSFRFSNDFSEREKRASTSVSSMQQFDLDVSSSPAASHATPPVTQKLRFDDNIKISQFDDGAFEDDFAATHFDFDNKDNNQWPIDSFESNTTATEKGGGLASKKPNARNSRLQQRSELIKKSESINIFAKKSDDPFEDDDFFKSAGNANTKSGGSGGGDDKGSNNCQWDEDNNFARFDENM